MRMSRQSRLEVIVVMAFVLALAFMPANAQAIGVTPGRTTIDFEPNLERTVTFRIINNEHKDFRAFVYAEGDLKDYVTSENNIIDFK